MFRSEILLLETSKIVYLRKPLLEETLQIDIGDSGRPMKSFGNQYEYI